MTANGTEEILRRAGHGPKISHVARRLLDIVAREDHDTGEVILLVESDQVLTAQILKMANSAAFSRGGTVTTVDRAVLNLGERLVAGLAIQSSAQQLFDNPLVGYAGQQGELWRHSLLTAIASRELAPLARSEVNLGLCYTAGLLHDLGKTIISEYLEGRLDDLLGLIDGGQATGFLQAEEMLIGVNHCRVGLEMARQWQLPPPLAAAIYWHHRPGQAPNPDRPLVYLVHLGDVLAMMAGQGTGADALRYELDERYTEYVDLTPTVLERLIVQINDTFELIQAAIFGAE